MALATDRIPHSPGSNLRSSVERLIRKLKKLLRAFTMYILIRTLNHIQSADVATDRITHSPGPNLLSGVERLIEELEFDTRN